MTLTSIGPTLPCSLPPMLAPPCRVTWSPYTILPCFVLTGRYCRLCCAQNGALLRPKWGFVASKMGLQLGIGHTKQELDTIWYL